MDGGVIAWILSFVQAAISGSSPSASTSATPPPENGGASSSVPENGASSILTCQNVTLLVVVRDPALETTDAFFGRMYWEENFLCYTMERIAVAIPEGTYRAYKRDSAHFGMKVVGIDVPSHTDIEMHPANFPIQLEGCIALGESIDNGALDNSRAAFDKMMAAVPEEFTVEVSSR